MATIEQTQEAIDRFHRDGQYFDANREDLLRRYPECWVAILDERVVGTDPDFEKLLLSLEEAGLPLEQVFIDRATAQSDVFILPG